MTRIAVKDGIAYERVGVGDDDTEVRRIIRAGAEVPDQFRVEDSSLVEERDPAKLLAGYRDHLKANKTEEVVVSDQLVDGEIKPLTIERKVGAEPVPQQSHVHVDSEGQLQAPKRTARRSTGRK